MCDFNFEKFIGQSVTVKKEYVHITKTKVAEPACSKTLMEVRVGIGSTASEGVLRPIYC